MATETAPGPANKVDRRQIDYTRHAANYNQQRFQGSANEYLERIRRIALLKAIGPVDRGANVLDVGCGTGRGVLALNSAGFHKIVGVDLTAAMLEQAARAIQSPDVPSSVRLLRGNAFGLPFSDGTFDLVCSLNFLHMFHLQSQQELIAEMTRVCRPGGRVVVELESIHKGLFFTRYWEQRRVRHRTKFNNVRDVARLFPRETFGKPIVVGTALPLAYRVLKRVPRGGERIESLVHVPPFNWLAERVFVAAKRRGE